MQVPTNISPALTVALALAVGTLGQALADRFQFPAIVLLLALGVAFGPDGLNLVHPSALGGGLLILVGFAVAVILFEGGMHLQWRRIQREDRVIRRLVLGGALVTALGGTLAARFILDWPWPISVLFGTLVIVTGPTVVTPLLRRLKVEHSIATVLEAEGVLIDSVGAIVAAGALEVVLVGSGESLFHAVMRVALGLVLGSIFGSLAGLGISALMRFIPEALRNVSTLSLVLVLFHASNAVLPESGIAVVTFAGVVVGNRRREEVRELFLFKEQLTLLLIGMLFVLLAADVQLARVAALGLRGVLVVLVLMVLVRPLTVALSTYGTSLNLRQRAFMAWVAPRGIVAAAMASLFSVELEAHGYEGGRALRALVFLTIAITVVSAGATGGIVAKLLGLRRPADTGWVILGANELARFVGRALKNGGEEVVHIDTDPHACRQAEEDGLRVLHADGLEARTLQRAYIDTRAGAIGLAQSTEANLLFADRVKAVGRLKHPYVGVGKSRASYAISAVNRRGARVLFGQAVDLDHWNVRLRRQAASGEVWLWTGRRVTKGTQHPLQDYPEDLFLPVVTCGPRRARPAGEPHALVQGERLIVLVNRERAEELDAWLASSGFEREGPLAGEEASALDEGRASRSSARRALQDASA